MTKITRGKFDEETSIALKKMISDLKSRGKHVKLTPSDLACWIIKSFDKELYSRRKDLLYYTFSDDNAYAVTLISSKVPLKDIEKSLKEFRQKKEEILRKHGKSSKPQGNKKEIPTTPLNERKVEFE